MNEEQEQVAAMINLAYRKGLSDGTDVCLSVLRLLGLSGPMLDKAGSLVEGALERSTLRAREELLIMGYFAAAGTRGSTDA